MESEPREARLRLQVSDGARSSLVLTPSHRNYGWDPSGGHTGPTHRPGEGVPRGGQAGLPSLKNTSCPELRKKHPHPCHLPSYVFPPRNKVSRTRYRRTYPFHSHHNNMQNKCPFTQGTRVWCLSSGRGPAPRKDEPQSFQDTSPPPPPCQRGGPANVSTAEANTGLGLHFLHQPSLPPVVFTHRGSSSSKGAQASLKQH